MVEERLARIIHNSYVDRKENFGVILKHKGLPDLSWDDFLPESYGGFRRLIKPNDAVRIINGSYMILSYYDKASRSGLSLMYNVLRDDFFAERRCRISPIWFMTSIRRPCGSWKRPFASGYCRSSMRSVPTGTSRCQNDQTVVY